MKNKEIVTKEFDAVQFMRQQRDRINTEICDLTKEQIFEYFKKRVPKERILPIF